MTNQNSKLKDRKWTQRHEEKLATDFTPLEKEKVHF